MKNWWVILLGLSLIGRGLEAKIDCQKYFNAIKNSDEFTVFSMSYEYQEELRDCSDSNGDNALHIFARSSVNFNIYTNIKYLSKMDFSSVNNQQRTALHEAVIVGNFQVVSWLLLMKEIRETLPWRDSEQRTAYEWAQAKKNPRVILLFDELERILPFFREPTNIIPQNDSKEEEGSYSSLSQVEISFSIN